MMDQMMMRYKLYNYELTSIQMMSKVPTRETLMRQSDLLVNAKQGMKKTGRKRV